MVSFSTIFRLNYDFNFFHKKEKPGEASFFGFLFFMGFMGFFSRQLHQIITEEDMQAVP